ncbi:MAG TPA: CinA family protein [Burkholderiales bacterium]
MIELSQSVGAALKARGLKLATAESCTGGWVSMALTAVAGSSDWFERGYVTYSNAAKREELGVAEETLRGHGAVSEETAREMAAGAIRKAGVQVALAITGVAGPTGGTAAKPVGTVCFAWARGGKISSETKRFEGDRESVRRQSVQHALQGLLQRL